MPHLTAAKAVSRKRHHLALVMDMLVASKAKVPYDHRGIRPQATAEIHTENQLVAALQSKRGLPPCDCSETIDLLFRVCDLLDPSGPHFNWNGLGNTDTFYDHLPHYTEPHFALVGAIVIFGDRHPNGTQHGSVVRRAADDKHSADPLLFSHGGDLGPGYILLSEERKYHSGAVTFLNIQSLLV